MNDSVTPFQKVTSYVLVVSMFVTAGLMATSHLWASIASSLVTVTSGVTLMVSSSLSNVRSDKG